MTEPRPSSWVTHAGRSVDPLTEPSPGAGPTPAGRSPGAGTRAVVQFHRSLRRDERARLERDLGLVLTEYLPDFGYVETIGPGVLAELEDDPLVRGVTAFPDDFRRPPGEGRRRFSTPAARNRSERHLEAVLFADADPEFVAAALRRCGAVDALLLDDRQHGGAVRFRFRASDDTAAQVARLDDVRWLDDVGEARPDGPADSGDQAPVPGGQATAGTVPARAWAAPLWKLGLTGRGQVIGMLDSPVDLGHCFFADPAHPVGRQHGKIAGYRNAVAEPPAKHGTFVAGIAAGDDPARPGAHPDRGVAWAARLSCGNADDLETTGVLSALASAAADGARVHTNSWHDEPGIQYDQLAADLDTFAWLNEEHLIIGSSGNRGEAMGPPGTAKNTLSVSASRGVAGGFGDGADGPTVDGRQKPEVLAPGCSIRSAVAGTADGVELDRHVFLALGPVCASSWATPAVAGLVALVRQYFTEGRYPGGAPDPARAFNPSGALLRASVLAGCDDVDGLVPAGGPYPSTTAGWGPVRPAGLFTGPAAGRRLRVRDVRHVDGLGTGEVWSATFDLRAPGLPLAVTLVWTDPPGAAGATRPSVNRLDLTLTAPDGQVFGRIGAAGDTADGPIDTVQRVLVREPVAGRWTALVSGTAVNVGRPGQGFALAVVADLAEVTDLSEPAVAGGPADLGG